MVNNFYPFTFLVPGLSLSVFLDTIFFLSVSADEPFPPQELKSEIVEHHTNYSTVNVTWASKLNESRVDFYHYQLLDNFTHFVANTSRTAVELSIPHDVNISFVISAHNCVGMSPQIALIINLGKCTIP